MAAATLKLVVPSVRASPESLLDEAARFALLRDGVNELRATFAAGRAVLTRARITLVSSTATGGGVAEMLHQIVPIARELGATIDWLVIEPRADLAPVSSITRGAHPLRPAASILTAPTTLTQRPSSTSPSASTTRCTAATTHPSSRPPTRLSSRPSTARPRAP